MLADAHISWQASDEEYHQLLELCRERDVAAAGKLLREHIESRRQSLKQVCTTARATE